MSDIILAAGAVLWRENNQGDIELALVHRPKYDDWSFPKGKIEIGESLISCAYREVLEETNVTSEFGPYLGKVEYLTEQGLKQVSFWAAKAIGEKGFVANLEVDQLKWVPLKNVSEILSMDSDRKILNKFVKIQLNTNPLILLRHAKAITRDEWQGDDDDRPLDNLGQNQALRLLSIYQVYNLNEIHTSDSVRCYDTVEPMAKSLKIKLEVTSKLSETVYRNDKDQAIEYAKQVLKEDKNSLICSHNPILPKILNKLTKKSEIEANDQKLSPADCWVIHRIGKEIFQVDQLDAPVI